MRHLNLLEYQSKVLLDNHGVTVQKFRILDTHEAAGETVKTLSKDKLSLFLIEWRSLFRMGQK